MNEHRSRPFHELPDWEKKICRDRENKRKAMAKEKRRQDRCRFIIGELVVTVFPELLQAELYEDSVAYKKLNAFLVYVREHPDVYQACDASSNMCTYTKSSTEEPRDGNVQL